MFDPLAGDVAVFFEESSDDHFDVAVELVFQVVLSSRIFETFTLLGNGGGKQTIWCRIFRSI